MHLATIHAPRLQRSVEFDHTTYSLARALATACDPLNPADCGIQTRRLRGLEAAVSEALFDGASEVRPNAFAAPLDALAPRFRTLDSTTAASFLSPTLAPVSLFVDVLRAKSVAAALGVQFISASRDGRLVQIPTKDSAAAVAWIAENAAVPSVNPNFSSTPSRDKLKTLGASTFIERKALLMSNRTAYDVAIADLNAGFAAALDRAVFVGDGELEPEGILTLDGIPRQPIGANGGPITRAALIEAMRTVGNANGDASTVASMGWATSPDGEAAMRSVDGSTAGGWLWTDGGRVLGKPAYSTTNIPADVVKGSGEDLTPLIYGNWADILVDHAPYVQFSIHENYEDTGGVKINAWWDARIIVRHKPSFVIIPDMATA